MKGEIRRIRVTTRSNIDVASENVCVFRGDQRITLYAPLYTVITTVLWRPPTQQIICMQSKSFRWRRQTLPSASSVCHRRHAAGRFRRRAARASRHRGRVLYNVVVVVRLETSVVPARGGGTLSRRIDILYYYIMCI